MKFDVFLSFRGIDTRRTFVSHLLLSLFKKQITTYKHEEEILKNQPPYPQVRLAIEESKIAIVVISKNYAASSCCLDELAKIIECKEKGSLEVVPIFYEVDPSDVLTQVDDLEDHGYGDNCFKKVIVGCQTIPTLLKDISCTKTYNLPMAHTSQTSEGRIEEESCFTWSKSDLPTISPSITWRDAMEKLIEVYHQKYSYWEEEDSYSYIVDRVLIHVSHCLSVSKTLSEDVPIIEYEYLREEAANPSEEEFVKVIEPCIDVQPPLRGMAEPETYLCSLQCLSDIVSKEIELVAAALRTIAEKFMYGEESSGVKPRPPGSLLDVNDNYATSNNLSRLVLSNDFNSFVGMDQLMKAVLTLLDLESRETLEIGISGDRGIGKTTLARCIYEQISSQFQDHHYFTTDTTNCSQGMCLLDHIARVILTEEFESLNEVVKAKLGHRKVLLIVDNISKSRHLENIRNIARWFGSGSRLIFVSHHKSLLLDCRVERLYVVESLRYDEALQLFSLFAFKQDQVPREYYQLSVRAVTITGRIPLALKVFGTFLCGKHISEWEHELCRFEIPQSRWDCVAKVSSYIGRALS